MGITNDSRYHIHLVSIHFLFHCFQDEIEATCPDLLRLGLLSEVGTDAATVKDQSPCVCFHHKSLQDYSASKHVVDTLEKSHNIKVIYKNYTFVLVNIDLQLEETGF